MKPCVLNSPSSIKGNSGTPEINKKVEENWGKIYKRNPQRFLFSGDPSSYVGSHPIKMYLSRC